MGQAVHTHLLMCDPTYYTAVLGQHVSCTSRTS